MEFQHSSERAERLERLFEHVVELDPPSRAVHLERACRHDADLRAEVESLLLAYDANAATVRSLFDALPLAKPPSSIDVGEGITGAVDLSGHQVGHYRILDKLGGGGMSVVYQAYDPRLDRIVAVKFLPPHLISDELAKARFTQEAKAASALDHTNICTIHDIGETEDGQLYIAMSYYPGQTLKEKIAHGAMPIAETIDVALQTARGLDKAHSAGIVHRDIKPANLLVTEEEVVKILDFGIAKIEGIDLTRTGTTMGTVSYMSPEQVRGEDVDERTDVWSLGAVLYEMITGTSPFSGSSDHALIYSLLNTDPNFDAIEDPEVRAVVEACLRKASADRFASAAELAEALTRLANGLPGIAPPVTRKRNRLSALTIGLAAVAATVIALATWLLSKPGPGVDPGPTQRQMLVVLPFDNLGQPGDQYLADGMVEELSSRLSSISSLGVISRNTANRYRSTEKTTPEIAKELGVDYVVGGSVRWVNQSDGSQRVRIAPYMTRVSDGTQIWAEAYDRQLTDVLDVQRHVAAGIVNELAAALKPGEIEALEATLTDDPDAYLEYLRGMAIIWKASLHSESRRQAVVHFQKALDLDSLFVEAAFRVAQLVSDFVFVETAQAQRKAGSPDSNQVAELQRLSEVARDAAARARRFAPGSRADLLANAAYSLGVLRDPGGALKLLTKAEEVTQDADVLQAAAVIYGRTGNVQLAYDYLQRMTALDPANAPMWVRIARMSRYLRKFDRSLEYYERATAIDSTLLIFCKLAQTQLYADLNTVRARQTLAASPRSEHCHEIDFFDHRFQALTDHYESPESDQRAWGEHFYAAESYRHLGLPEKEMEAWNATNHLRQFGLVAIREAGKGNREDALAALEQDRMWYGKEKGMAAINYEKDAAWVYALLGMEDELLGAIEADAGGPGWMNRAWLMRPTFDRYRDGPRFKTLMKRYESWETE